MAIVGSYVALSKTLILIFPLFVLAGMRFGIAALAMAGWVRRVGPRAGRPFDAIEITKCLPPSWDALRRQPAGES